MTVVLETEKVFQSFLEHVKIEIRFLIVVNVIKNLTSTRF